MSRFAKVPDVRGSAESSTTDPSTMTGTPGTVPSQLEQFRSSSRRLTIHPLELALLGIVGVHLVFLPWALGTMRPWAQFVSLALSLLGFILALVPRTYTEDHTVGAPFRLVPMPKLLRFPIFWLGLALLGLIVIQALNPAWEYQTDGKSWWMKTVPHMEWLPQGVRVPFAMWGPWRMLMIYTAGLLTVCSVWVGFTRRRTVQRLFVLLAANGLGVAVFGISERILGATKIFWFVESPNPSFFASFIYKNHAGAYLTLVLAVACGVGAWFYLRGVRRLEKSNPSGVFAFIATCIAVSVLISYARGATLTMLVYLCVIVGAFVYHQFKLPKESRSPIIAIALLLVFGFFLKTGLDALHSDLAWDRLRQAISREDVSVHAREVANQASFDMLQDNWVKGIGSGSFRFLFPVYQQNYSEIFTGGGRRVFWEHAHNDVLQFPIEFGLAGMLILLAGFGYWAAVLMRAYAWQNPLSASVVVGCLFMIGMSWGDFVFQCPAVLITWCAMWPACTLWARLEEQRGT